MLSKTLVSSASWIVLLSNSFQCFQDHIPFVVISLWCSYLLFHLNWFLAQWVENSSDVTNAYLRQSLFGWCSSPYIFLQVCKKWNTLYQYNMSIIITLFYSHNNHNSNNRKFYLSIIVALVFAKYCNFWSLSMPLKQKEFKCT